MQHPLEQLQQILGDHSPYLPAPYVLVNPLVCFYQQLESDHCFCQSPTTGPGNLTRCHSLLQSPWQSEGPLACDWD